MQRIADVWAQLFPGEQQRITRLLIEQVQLHGMGWTSSGAGRLDRLRCRHRRASAGGGIPRAAEGAGVTTTTNPRKRTVHIEVGTDARSYVSGGQRVTLVPLTIKHRQNRKLLIPPAPDATGAAGGFDVPMIKTLSKAFYWKRLIDEGVYPATSDLARALKVEVAGRPRCCA